MRTISQLGAITGVSKYTLKYWSAKRRVNDRGRNVGGAGVLVSNPDPRNNYRLFGDDALLQVLSIQLAERAGFQLGEFQSCASVPGHNLGADLGRKICDLEAERDELESKLAFARALDQSFSLRGDAFVAASLLCDMAKLLLADFSAAIGARMAQKPLAEKPSTQPPTAEKPSTRPPATQRSATQPPATQKPAAQPPVASTPLATSGGSHAAPATASTGGDACHPASAAGRWEARTMPDAPAGPVAPDPDLAFLLGLLDGSIPIAGPEAAEGLSANLLAAVRKVAGLFTGALDSFERLRAIRAEDGPTPSGRAFEEASSLVQKVWHGFGDVLGPRDLADVLAGYLAQGYPAIVLELLFGESFSAYVTAAMRGVAG